jgi:asparagine synthase (glutamine-hydrolysing)
MCGIGGVIYSKLGREDLLQALLRMQRQMHHRGPDDSGIFISDDGAAGLVSTRLAIQDLTPAGHQPMSSRDGRYYIVFNGEIYNFKTLRDELLAEGEVFLSRSDTEVILKMYARYGPECVREFEGMFAIAIWDEREKTCLLARDAFGIKPVYFYNKGGFLVLGSELRTLLASGLVPLRCSTEAVAGYLLSGAVPEPLTLVEDAETLAAGHYLLWRDGSVRITKYWDVQFGYESCPADQAPATVREGLIESVKRHLVSDVPVGLFLSGGLDSTALVALASKEIADNLRTFCISFDNPDFNEGDVAARTAAHFRARHSDWRLDSTTAKRLLADFLESSDQPSIDGFNTYCVSKLAHDEGFKVVLSGLGGDELFGGYPSFDLIPGMVRGSRALNPLPFLRKPAAKAFGIVTSGPRAKRLAHFLQETPTTAAAYWTMRGIFTPSEVKKLLPCYCGTAAGAEIRIDTYVPSQPTLPDEVSYLELTRYMRNQLLRDGDVMSMAWSLELRLPFVDRKLAETLERIPAQYRLAAGKQILLDAIPEIPAWVRKRPKRGFTFPFEEWITGEWQDTFRRIEAESPIRLQSWYRCWCLFALESFLTINKIEPPRALT